MGGDPGKQGCLYFTGEVFAGKSGDPGLQVGVRIEEENYHVRIRGVWSVGGEKTRHQGVVSLLEMHFKAKAWNALGLW